MPRQITICLVLLSSVLLSKPAAHAATDKEQDPVRAISQRVQQSVVKVTTENREGEEAGIGSGFVISDDGLIATSLHVIGEARPIWVQRQGGEKLRVIEVHASDRTLDLAIVRVQSKGWPALVLADKKVSIQKGQSVVAVGHPLGFENSVVAGVVSGRREINGLSMLQVAIPIEPGNSGGPLVDLDGRVHGVLALKSTQSDNLGFAVDVAELRKLIERPNPIPIERWKTIGRVDMAQWTPRFGARWQQRSGRVVVDGAGSGFGGRSLLLATAMPPLPAFELAVSVKLDDESGAAGLLFHSDGEDRHYGFYPSSGRLRLTSFEGPTVFSWNVLSEVASPHYRPGRWNDLKVIVNQERIRCYVNEQLVIESEGIRLAAGRVGLAKFRDTQAEFKHFRVGQKVSSLEPTEEAIARVTLQTQILPATSEIVDQDLRSLAGQETENAAALRVRAEQLLQQAEELKQLADDVHVLAVCDRLRQLTSAADDEVDLLRAALWISRLDNAELPVDDYVRKVDRMAEEVAEGLPKDASEPARLKALNDYLFARNGFHGSRMEYYHRANSYLDHVLDDREGLPITLSVLYMELGKRLDLRIVGVGLPGHFVVRFEPREGEPTLIDVFDGGKELGRADAELRVLQALGQPLREDHLSATTNRAILTRMLTNLLGVAERKKEPRSMLRYAEAMVAVDPDSVSARGMRAVLRQQNGRRRAALEDLDWILSNQPEGIDLDQIRLMREAFTRDRK